MLIDRYPPEDVCARVPELADQTDPVLVELDRLLADDQLCEQVRHDLAQRSRLTPVPGRHSPPAAVILRLLVVQHLYGWSTQETVERVADSLVLRWFCRGYFQRVPDKATRIRWAHTIQPPTLQALTDRAGQRAQQAKVTRARKLRIDSTCVQTPIHPPTDSSLLGDGVRVLNRLIQRAKPLVVQSLAGVRQVFRSRRRTVRRLLRQVHRISRVQGEAAAEQQRALYARLLETTQQTVRQAERVRAALSARGARDQPETASAAAGGRAAEQGSRHLQAHCDGVLPRVRRVMAQARTRVRQGRPVPAAAQVLSLLEPHTRVVKRAKAGAPVAFGRQVALDEVEGGIVTRFHVRSDEESACHQALPAVQQHRALFGRPPWVVVGDRRLHTKGVAESAHGLGVTHVVIPRTGPLTGAQRAREQQRSWRRRSRGRAGIAGRIHSLRRD
jgi:transposase, IS5 family